MLNQQTEAFKDETTSKQQRLRFLQSRFPTVNVRDGSCTLMFKWFKCDHTETND